MKRYDFLKIEMKKINNPSTKSRIKVKNKIEANFIHLA